jgi:hypothetical protein
MLRRLVPLLGVNAVPLGGVFLAGWSPATALTLYWWENLTGSALVALRIALHRALTRKRGHQRLQLGLHSSVDYEARGRKRREREAGEAGSFLGEFLVYAGAGTALHGVLLWALLGTFLESGPEGDQLRLGVLGIGFFQLAGFLWDLVGIRRRPFAWIRELAEAAAARVSLIHLTLIAGFWYTSGPGGLSGFFGPFAVLKTMADFGNALAHLGVRADPEEAPVWLAATINRLAPDRGDFAAYWRERKARERALRERDEQVAG